MKKIILFLSVLIGPLLLLGQRQHPSSLEITPKQDLKIRTTKNQHFRAIDQAPIALYQTGVYPKGATPRAKADQYIQELWPQLGFRQSIDEVLVHQKTRNLYSGSIIWYAQYYKGLKVNGGGIQVKINPDGAVGSFLNSSLPISNSISTSPRIDQASAFDRLNRHLKANGDYQYKKQELLIHTINTKAYLAWQIKVITTSTLDSWEAYVDAQNGQLLEVRAVFDYYSDPPQARSSDDNYKQHTVAQPIPKATIKVKPTATSNVVDGEGNVFAPSPTHTAKQLYNEATDFKDDND
ncbi:MAG: hypothetical protein AAGD05_04880 [Bacteroidota bacterium]